MSDDDDDELQALREARRAALGNVGAERLEALRRRAAASARDDDGATFFADAGQGGARDAPVVVGPPRPPVTYDGGEGDDEDEDNVRARLVACHSHMR